MAYFIIDYAISGMTPQYREGKCQMLSLEPPEIWWYPPHMCYLGTSHYVQMFKALIRIKRVDIYRHGKNG